MLNCVEKCKVVGTPREERRTYHRWLNTTNQMVLLGRTSLLGIEGYWVRGLRGEGDGFVVERGGRREGELSAV